MGSVPVKGGVPKTFGFQHQDSRNTFKLITSEKLKHEYSEGPVVGADIVALVQDDLGSDVFGSATEGPGFAADLQFLGEAKVNQLDVAVLIQKQIFGLKIPKK